MFMFIKLVYCLFRLSHLVALLLDDLQLVLGLPELGLVRLVRLHGGVKLVQHLQHLLVNLVADLATLKIGIC